MAKAGTGDDLVYKTITGLKSDLSGAVTTPEILNPDEGSDDESDGSSSSNCDEGDDEQGIYYIESNPILIWFQLLKL